MNFPRSLDDVLEHTAAVAAGVVGRAALSGDEVEELATFFERNGAFLRSLAEWLRADHPDGDPTVSQDDSGSYRPWQPYRLVDVVVDCEPGVRAVTRRLVRSRECHRPEDYADRPMSAALLLEALGHTALICLQDSVDSPAPAPGKMSARFIRPVHAGETLTLECKVLREAHGFAFVEGTALVDLEVVARATFAFRIIRVAFMAPVA